MENLEVNQVETDHQILDNIQDEKTGILNDKEKIDNFSQSNTTEDTNCIKESVSQTEQNDIDEEATVDPTNEDKNSQDDELHANFMPINEEQNLTDDVTEVLTSDEVNEAYNNIMSVCSTAAEAIKKTINEVLNSRSENASFSANDSTNELEASLREKIADFENIVSDCKDKDSNLEKKIDAKNNSLEIVNDNKSLNTMENDPNISKEEKISETPIVNKFSEQINEKPKENKENGAIAKIQFESSLLSNALEENYSKIKQSDPSLLYNGLGEKYIKKAKSNSKKKVEKTIDQVLKSLSNCPSSEAKLQMLCKKHVETLEELKTLEPRLKQSERQIINLSREKEQLQADYNRAILAKSRLESLCRELQKQSKEIKEESLLRIREEEEKRKEVANKFQATLNDISALMQENSKKNSQLREENAELAKKLKSLVDHYETWEKHMEKVVQQKDLETQLAKAQNAKTNLLLKQETEKFLREKHFLLENMGELQKKCTTLASNELQLRTELGDYTSKYEEFQAVLNKSSQVFASFKNDMDTTSKKIKKLEKQTNVYKQKWQSSNTALIEMMNDKEKSDKELTNAHLQLQTLERLCRALQEERKELRNQVKTLSAKRDSQEKENVPSSETQIQ